MFNINDGEEYEEAYKVMEDRLANTDFENDSGDGWGTIKKDTGLSDA
jgi:hypothetical protein